MRHLKSRAILPWYVAICIRKTSDCSLADLPETDPAMNILSLTQVYLDILCHVTYILNTLQDDLRRHVSEQNSEHSASSVLGHLDLSCLELDLSIRSHGDQARLLIPDSVCSDSPSQAEGLTLGTTTPGSAQLEDRASCPGWESRQRNWFGHCLGKCCDGLVKVVEKSGAYGRM